jgi:DNA-binding LacI/PurR family transcriptional regulator
MRSTDRSQLEQPRQRATLRDVAALAGVSTATASNALRGNPVSALALERVRRAAANLDYTPHAAGRSLRTGQPGQIGLWVNAALDNTSPVLAGLVLGAVNGMEDSGYSLQVAAIGNAPGEWQARIAEVAASGRYAAFIAAHLYRDDTSWWVPVRAHGLPLVVMNDGVAAADIAIMTDNRSGMRLLMEHLHALGHRSVGTIAGTEGHNEADIRLDAFYRAAANLGMRAPEAFVMRAEAFSIAEGERAMTRLLGTRERADLPTAIVCGDDRIAIGALRASLRHGLRVPGDLSIVGFDDAWLAEVTTPPLTTIRQSHARVGQAAAEAAIELVSAGIPIERITRTIPVDLVVRDSSGPPAR